MCRMLYVSSPCRCGVVPRPVLLKPRGWCAQGRVPLYQAALVLWLSPWLMFPAWVACVKRLCVSRRSGCRGAAPVQRAYSRVQALLPMACGLVRLQSVAVRGCPSAVPVQQALPKTCAPRLSGVASSGFCMHSPTGRCMHAMDNVVKYLEGKAAALSPIALHYELYVRTEPWLGVSLSPPYHISRGPGGRASIPRPPPWRPP